MALGIPRCDHHHSSLCLHGHLLPPPLPCIPQNPLSFSLTRYVLSWLSRVQLFATLGSCNSMRYTLPASSVHGILQARILERVLPCLPLGDLPDLGIEPTHLLWLLQGRQILYHWATREAPYKVYVIVFNTTGTKEGEHLISKFSV